MNEAPPLISIIVPFYGTEKYLEKCVDSILSQTFTDYELLLVDDGSPKEGKSLCDRMALKSGKIHVIHKDNGGLSDARNTGLKAAAGRYIGFVDSDDYLAPEMYSRLYESISSYEADVSICGYLRVCKDSGRKAYLPKKEILNGREMLQKLSLREPEPYITAWNKLYRRELFDSAEFTIGKWNEDVFLFCPLFWQCKKIVCIDEPLYYYVYRQESITGQKKNLKQTDHAEAFYTCFLFAEQKGLHELLPSLEKQIFGKLTLAYYSVSDIEKKSGQMRKAKKWHRDALRRLLKHRLLNPHTAIRSALFYWCPKLYGRLKRIPC